MKLDFEWYGVQIECSLWNLIEHKMKGCLVASQKARVEKV